MQVAKESCRVHYPIPEALRKGMVNSLTELSREDADWTCYETYRVKMLTELATKQRGGTRPGSLVITIKFSQLK